MLSDVMFRVSDTMFGVSGEEKTNDINLQN